MKYRKQDENGDMVFGNGLLDFYIDTPEAVGLSVETRLRLWTGEWFLDLAEGTQYQTNVLGYGKLDSAPVTIRRRILTTDGVTTIDSFDYSFDPDTRKFSVKAVIDTVYGQTSVEVIQ